MHDTYFCSLVLGKEPTAPPPFEPVADLICDWLNNPRRQLAQRLTPKMLVEGIRLEPGPGISLTSLRVSKDDVDAFGVRLDHPDADEQEIFWRTDIIVSRQVEGSAVLRMSVRVAMGSTDDSLVPIQVAYSRPRLVPQIIETFGAHGVVPIALAPHLLRADSVREFVGVLTNPERSLPVVLVSARNWDDKPLTDPSALSDQLAGLAHVFVSESRFVSHRLKELLEPRLNCYDGSVRIYWPGLQQTDNPFKHPLWLPDRIRMIDESPLGFPGHVLARIGRASVHRFVPGVARWGDLERAHMQAHLAELRKAGNAKEMLDLFEIENVRLEQENRDLKLRVESLEGEAERARNETTAWRQSYEDLRKTEKETGAQRQEQPIDSVDDALTRIGEEYKDELLFTAEIAPNPLFDNPDGLYLALRWLATTYRNARLGRESCSDFDHSCREASGFWYRPHQSKVTMGKYEDDYYVLWQGKKVALKEHIGTGSSKDGRSTMRIAFFLDDDTEAVVVGFMGQHQSTDAT